MTFIRAMNSAFNIQTVLLLLGLALLVAGIWALLGWPCGLIALGLALILIALLINQNTTERK